MDARSCGPCLWPISRTQSCLRAVPTKFVACQHQVHRNAPAVVASYPRLVWRASATSRRKHAGSRNEKATCRASKGWTSTIGEAAARRRRTLVCQAGGGEGPAVSFDLDLAMPSIDGDIKELQAEDGAEFEPASDVPVSFSNDDEALKALAENCVICDRSHWGRIRVSGDDAARFLHNQTTADIQRLSPGQGTEAVFVTPTARTIDVATVYAQDKSFLVVTSPETAQQLLKLMDKYIFFADKVKLQDLSQLVGMLTIAGPQSKQIIRGICGEAVASLPLHSHTRLKLDTYPVVFVAGSGLASDGFTFLAEAAAIRDLWAIIRNLNVPPMGSRAWERARIHQGKPRPGFELTDDFNPLEACLLNAISTEKGCYIGQETVARLLTYGGVKQMLWGINIKEPRGAGSGVSISGETVGKLTSCTIERDPTTGLFSALAYIKTRSPAAQGVECDVSGASGMIVSPPISQPPPASSRLSSTASSSTSAERFRQ